MSESGGAKKTGAGALGSLTKEELVGRCKSLLQLAQKAKKAKDDAQKQNEVLQEESEKQKKVLIEQISVLESKNEDNEDVLKAKKRQLDRLTEENESILEQMDTYCSQLKVVTKEKAEVEKKCKTFKEALAKSEKQAGKAMELEANMICLKESEKQMSNKLKMLEQTMAVEKKLGSDKNSQLTALSKRLEKAEADAIVKQGKLEILSDENELKTDGNSQLLSLQSEINNLNSKFEECKTEKHRVEDNLQECQSMLQEKGKFLELSSENLKEIHETSRQQLSDIDTLRDEVMDLEDQNKNFVIDHEKFKGNINSMEKQLEQKESDLKQIEIVKSELERGNLEYEQKNSGLIEELNQFNQEMKKRGERIEKLEKANSDQLMKMRNLEKLQIDNNSMGEHVDEIRLELEEKTNLLKSQEMENKDLVSQIVEYKSKNSSLESKETKLKNELDEYISEKEILTQNVSELNIEMVKLKETLLDEEKLFAKNMEEVEKNIQEKREQVECIQKEKVNLTEKVSILEGFEMKFDEASSMLGDAKSRGETLENEKNNLLDQVSSMTDEVEHRSKEIQTMKSKLTDLESQLKKSAESQELQETEIDQLKELNNSMTKLVDSKKKSKEDEDGIAANQILEIKLKETVNINLKLSGELEEIKFNLEEKLSQNLKLSGDFEALKFKLEETNDQNEKANNELKSLKEDKMKTKEENTDLIEKLNVINKSMDLANRKIEELDISNKELQNKIETVEPKYEASLNEFKEMKQQVEIYEQDFEQLNVQNASAKKDNEILSSTVATLKSQLEASKCDIAKMTKSLEETKEESSRSKSLNSTLPDNDDSRSEAMSTSTVSRAEEYNRMRDVEDSFEDRYSKLKLIAIKLKKKAGDQEKKIKELEARNARSVKTDDGDSPGFKDKMASLTKNFNNLQSQYDAAVDKLENVEKEAKTLRKDLEASLTECVASKQKSEESIQQELSAKTELTKMEEKAREAEGKVHSLEITIDEERKERKLLETNAKKNDELASQLRDKMGENFLIEETVQSLKLQIVQLEETLSREQDRADHAHKTLTSTRGQLTQAETDLARQKIETDELNKKYEDSVRATELLQEQFGDVIKSSEKEQGLEKSKVFQLERQVSALESNLVAKTQNLDSKEKDLNKVSKEFDNYKLRAQSVLKQSKDKASEEESSKKQEDLFAMEKLNDALNDKLKSLSLEIRTISIERNGLQDEHDRMMERQSLLLQELATKEKNWREKSDQQDVKIRQVEEDKTGNLERVQKTMENLKQIHLQEMEMMKNANQIEISKLKQQIDAKENEVIRLDIVLQKEQEARRHAEENVGRTGGAVGGFDNRLDICQIEREACEGQEKEHSSGPSPSSSMTSPLPLEQLLAQNDPPDTVSEGLRSNSGSRVGGADRQVSHLAALLSESEAQNSRLEKLTEVLKEEIRIYQRSEERHKQIENLEYVKNVILKFLTLTGAQERARLIPVLKTILKLKKEEVDKVMELVKAEEEAKGGGEGWGSYLHLWSAAP
eukprot:GFUD01122575.1.p1 GENE.GFUD01122575.1~~GFUD01122575.1.p1  ORF type:complete len:1513 (+),score=587.82 GFUD01122575.1:87-4625(+)